MNTKTVKDFLRAKLPWPIFKKLKRCVEEWKIIFSDKTLTSFARIYKTDKWGRHAYTPIYHFWFNEMRYKPVKLLEIGVGGNENPQTGGNSLRMWKRYFPKASITGIDLYDKSAQIESRIRICQGDQSDPVFLQKVSNEEGPFDIIIDDGSHMQSHIITSFLTLFPLLAANGVYVIEDTHTSYSPSFEGSATDLETANTSMNYFIRRIHQVNSSDWRKPDVQYGYPKDEIKSIAFYHNLIVIVKK